MNKRFLLFLILYLTGMAMSPILAGHSFHAKKTLLCSLEESGLSELESQYKWQDKLPDRSFGGLEHRFQFSGILFFISPAKSKATQNKEGNTCPLYILFHALLFYELS